MGQVTPVMPWDVSRLFGREKGKDIYIVGTGTSMTGFDYAQFANRVVIGLNDAPVIAKRAFAYHIWADGNIGKRYQGLHDNDKTIVVCDPGGRSSLTTGGHCKFADRIYQFKKQTTPNNLRDDNELVVQWTVASAAITLAWRLGAARMFIFGVDAYRTNVYYADGSLHRSGMTRNHRKVEDGRIVEDRHDRWVKEQRQLREWFTSKALYVGPFPQSGIYNCNPLSQIDAWEKIAPKEVLG